MKIERPLALRLTRDYSRDQVQACTRNKQGPADQQRADGRAKRLASQRAVTSHDQAGKAIPLQVSEVQRGDDQEQRQPADHGRAIQITNPKTGHDQHQRVSELPINETPEEENVVARQQQPAREQWVIPIRLPHKKPAGERNTDHAKTENDLAAREYG